MALTPIDEIHAVQIQAGILGRKAGHAFEDKISDNINNMDYPFLFENESRNHINIESPENSLLKYIASTFKSKKIEKAVSISTGALATSEEGKKWLEVNGVRVKRCKSDLIITIKMEDVEGEKTVGVSTKQCNNRTPTNAQLYFTTARGFSKLLNDNGFSVSERAVHALRQFCGDAGFRPLDNPEIMGGREIDVRRYFWEEIEEKGRIEWESIFSEHQENVTRLLLQKAYLDDPFAPDILLHKTKRSAEWKDTETAIYTIDELIKHSGNYGGFSTKLYSVRKGSFKDPIGVQHQAPRFGIVQMQRGGQQQHPEQLQFNLEAGYFYKIGQQRGDMVG